MHERLPPLPGRSLFLSSAPELPPRASAGRYEVIRHAVRRACPQPAGAIGVPRARLVARRLSLVLLATRAGADHAAYPFAHRVRVPLPSGTAATATVMV